MVDYFESPGPEVAQQTLFVKTEPGSVVPLMLGHLEQTDHRADARRLHANSDGTVVSWSWTFGNEASATQQHPSHTYGSGGTYSVTLTVTDNGGATGNTSQNVTVSDSSSGITLSVTGYKVKGLQKVDLTWSGATSTGIDVFRNGSKVAMTTNDGFYTDNIDRKGGGTYTFKVCEAGTPTCSNESTVVF